jgi:CheY-like chemotaxis protein
MPVMDGVTATHIIKSLELKWNPNIIAMTAYCLKEDKMRFVEAGMDDFIAKPISADKILSKVKYWTEKSFGASKPKPDIDAENTPVVKHLTIRGELESVFDFDVLKGLHKHLGDDILLDSIHEFAIETARMLTEMDAALLMENFDVLRNHSHTLKGNAGTFGVNHLSAIAKEMEFDLKNNKIAALSENLEKLREAANQFLKSYNLLNKSHEWKN